MPAITSNESLSALAQANIVFSGGYSFNNPESINGPFGTFSVLLDSNRTALGKMMIITLFGLGTETLLSFSGTSSFNGSTGYTTVNARGDGVIYIRPNPPRHVEVNITIVLAPGFEHGEVSASGFFDNLPCKLTSPSISQVATSGT